MGLSNQQIATNSVEQEHVIDLDDLGIVLDSERDVLWLALKDKDIEMEPRAP